MCFICGPFGGFVRFVWVRCGFICVQFGFFLFGLDVGLMWVLCCVLCWGFISVLCGPYFAFILGFIWLQIGFCLGSRLVFLLLMMFSIWVLFRFYLGRLWYLCGLYFLVLFRLYLGFCSGMV